MSHTIQAPGGTKRVAEPPRSHPPAAPRRRRFVSLTRARRVTAVILFLGLLAAPFLLSGFRLGLLAKYLTYAILAIGLDVAWGYGGMLSLGHGLFFGLGGYAMAMHLKLVAAGGRLPDFMSWSGTAALPVWWEPFSNLAFTLTAAVVVPALVGGGLGYIVFRNRVRGAYFAILTQALVAAFAIVLVGQQGVTGGTNGMTNFTTLAGYDLTSPAVQRGLYLIVVAALAGSYLIARQLVRSRFGSLLIATRDGEDRVRFLGYSPTVTKAATFAFSAALAGLAGALFVPIVGIIAPGIIGIIPSIQMVLWVAVGGRGTLYGAALGAVLFGLGQTTLSEAMPSGWLYLQGALLVAVLVFAPRGLAGLIDGIRRRVARVAASLGGFGRAPTGAELPG
ncbi:MAG: urea ABC transporter permease subunit UrtC [Actinobacteria bacterium]|nr:urea ABC transporter permease subunit UrtC [Actinomycetota bacterium]